MNVTTNSLKIQIVFYFEYYFAGVPARTWYLYSSAHHYEISLQRRATCAALPFTVLQSLTPYYELIERQNSGPL
jgi:hypothetical protein